MKHTALLLRFTRSEQGSVLPLVGLGMFMLIAATGIAIDMGRVQIVQSRLQNSLDAAGLAAGTVAHSGSPSTVATNYFNANFPSGYLGATIGAVTVTPNASNSVLSLSVSGTVNTTFMRIFNINSVAVSATSQITLQSSGMELVLVLDNTGSMNSPVNPANSSTPKITALQQASTTLLNILYGGSATVNNLWVGVVPFSQAVNVGTGNASWLDSTYDAALDFGPTITGTTCQGYNTSGTTTLLGGEDFAGTKATGVLTFSSNPATGKTIILDGVTWTFVSGTASTNQTKIGASLSATLTSLASNLNSSTNTSIKLATYYATSTALEITYKTVGTAGDGYTLAVGTAPDVITNPTSGGTYASTPKCTYTLNGNSAATSFKPQLNNWGGCVMARSSPYNTSDDTPTTAPFPAYDYPPTADAGITYDPWITNTTSGSSPYTTTTVYNYSYQSSLPGYYGPNLFCPKPVLPMVAEESTVLTEINSLTAGGSTLIDMGMAWGQRMLSPKWRGLWGGEMNTNSLPLNYNTPLMQKVVILMTDGMNSLSSGNFTAYNYLDKGVLGTTNTTTADSDLDTNTLAVCTALKNNGVIIYTIGFGTNGNNDPTDPQSVNGPMLQACASQPSYYFLAPTNAELTTAFQTIGDSLANLYISH